MISFFAEKLCGALLLLAVPLITGLVIPCILYRSQRVRPGSPAIEYINNLASGLLMGIFLLHLLPESTGSLRKELGESIFRDYPVGEFLLGLGFFIVLTMELAIVSYHRRTILCRDDGSTSFDELDSQESGNFGNSYGSTVNGNPMFDASFQYSVNSYSESAPILGPADANQLEQILSSSKVYVLLFGLSIHSFFEGLVIGLESKHWTFWTLVFVVLLHKSLVALALGISAFRVFLQIKDAFHVMLIFGVASPIGVLCGAALKEMLVIQHDTRIILASLNCVACGTFVFVIFTELLPEQLHKRASAKTITLIILGFVAISLIQLLCFTSL